ncbi:MAG: cytochrome c [Methylophilaceae bacterium]|nr:cytochrome c [Methylophilaceae bacterium]
MNKSIKTFVASTLAVLVVAYSLDAFAAPPKPEKLIQWRQSAYRVIEWNVARIKASVEGQYNKEEVSKAAHSIAAIANSGLDTLYPAGTEHGKGWRETAVKPELFKDTKRVAELSASFSKEANELTKVAAGGDAAAVKAQLGKLAKTCKACHDDYKESE